MCYHLFMEVLQTFFGLKTLCTRKTLKTHILLSPSNPEHKKIICFQFQNLTRQFKCLPFSLTLAHHGFTKVLKPQVAFKRRLGLRICIYIDDMLIPGKGSSDRCLPNDLPAEKRLGLLGTWKYLFYSIHRKWNS